MDVGKYDFECRKVLHFGLRYAKGLGHDHLECEHVALAVLRANWDLLPAMTHGIAEKALEQFLGSYPKKFGSIEVEFGPRLNYCLDQVEAKSDGLVSVTLLWQMLTQNSTILRNAIAKGQMEQKKGEAFQEVQFESLDEQPKTPHRGPSSDSDDATMPPEVHTAKKKAVEIDRHLKNYTTDLTELASRGDIDPIFGREQEIRRVLEVLGRKKKNNPILIGEPGVGKTAIAEGIALKIIEEKVPESLKGVRVLSLDLSSLVAGSRYRGEFEERLQKIIATISELGSKVILFIDEIHTIIGAGQAEGSMDAANILKPALARGELRCLGATTLAEYRRYFEKDAALERRFQPVTVSEPSNEISLVILRGLKKRYEIHHAVTIDDEALRAAVEYGDRYLPQRRLPDKAIDLVDEAASRLRLAIESVPRELDALQSQISDLEMQKQTISHGVRNQKALVQINVKLENLKKECEKIENSWRLHQRLHDEVSQQEKQMEDLTALYETAKSQGDFEFAAKLELVEIPKHESALQEKKQAITALEQANAYLCQVVGKFEIGQVISEWTGIPVSKILSPEKDQLQTIEFRLRERVYGQDEALNLIAKAVRRALTGVNDPRKPLGTFLLTGPTGVGKTETAKALAAELFTNEKHLIRFDMSEYMAEHQVARLIGSPPGYIGHGEGGELTDAVRNQPHAVVLFDEIEKAHPRVLDILLQVMDDGHLTDSTGKVADFKQTLIILTSNLTVYEDPSDPAGRKESLRNSLCEYLRPEFVNRIDEIVIYQALGSRELVHLIDKLLEQLNFRLNSRDLRISLDDDLREEITKIGLSSTYGGRGVQRVFREMVVDVVTDKLLEGEQWSGAWVLKYGSTGRAVFSEDHRQHQFLPPAR